MSSSATNNDVHDRPYAKDYSGLVNQAAAAGIVAFLCLSAHELMKRKRRGKPTRASGLGSVESWEFGYLYQGRSWAKNPSPPSPQGWPLSWVKQVTNFPEEKINELRGVDAAFYVRFLRGCFWWAMTQTVIVFPILFPIHYTFSPDDLSTTSLLRGDISSLIQDPKTKGYKLLWIHLVLIYWVTLSWIATVFWVVRGALKYRAERTAIAAARTVSADEAEKNAQYHPHPHPQFHFQALPPLDHDGWNRGLRHRTVMVTNLPVQLRSERELKEYFEYYLSRPVDVPAIGLPPSVQPGLINKFAAFVYNRVKKQRDKLPNILYPRIRQTVEGSKLAAEADTNAVPVQESKTYESPQIDRVVVVRKMSELATLLHRREEVLVKLETAHIKLAQRALEAVKAEMKKRQRRRPANGHHSSQIFLRRMKPKVPEIHVEEASGFEHEPGHDAKQGEGRMDLLIRILGPYVNQEEFDYSAFKSPLMARYKSTFVPGHRQTTSDGDSDAEPMSPADAEKTVWDALLSLPRSTLDSFQPLIHLSRVWRGKTVPAIDYYTAKLNVLNSLILELRAIDSAHVQPASTAFVTFKDPADARRACKYLAVHPSNPLACLVAMAPCYEDLDWGRLMKTTYRSEIVKDWVVGIGVWAFTIFWLIPVSFLLSLVNLQSFTKIWPALAPYFDKHRRAATLISSFLPTVLVSLLSILVPLILLLIAKKAHTIITLSELHDRIMTRYYKWLILNVLVFFCIGVAFLEGFFTKFRENANSKAILEIIQTSFPGAGPFYVGWLIFTTAMHGGFEIMLLGLPLIVYPSTKSQVTPRKRNVGIRPRTLNYYYWLPNHLLVIHVLLVFAVLNPLVLPFGMVYFAVEKTIIKNQLLHVYAKNYEGNGKLLIIRLLRYSFDGLMVAQVVFIAFMALARQTVNIVLGALLLALTLLAKIVGTRLCRSKFEEDDTAEANAVCGSSPNAELANSRPGTPIDVPAPPEIPDTDGTQLHPSFWTWRFPSRMNFAYNTMPGRHPAAAARRQPIPFGSGRQPFTRLRSMEMPRENLGARGVQPDARAAISAPLLHPASVASTPPIPSPASAPLAEPVPLEPMPPRKMVTRHAPHPAWDDESSPDQPYENPYLARDMENLLWLPRDPCGILNLDDTVDMHKCLTSTPGLGTLNQYSDDEGEEDDLGVLSMISSMNSVDDDDEVHMEEVVQQRLGGGPFIESPEALPAESPLAAAGAEIGIHPVIEAREKVETDIEESESKPKGRTSLTSPGRISISEATHPRPSHGPSSSPRRPSGFTAQQTGMTYRSFSGGSRISRRSRRASSSFLSSNDHRSSVPILDHEMGIRPPFRNQASFTRSTLSIVHASSAGDAASITRRSSRASRGPPSEVGTARLSAHTRYATSHVTAHEAVIEEAIAEERDAAAQREEREEEEEAKASERPPWWKAWAFTSTEKQEPPTPRAV